LFNILLALCLLTVFHYLAFLFHYEHMIIIISY